LVKTMTAEKKTSLPAVDRLTKSPKKPERRLNAPRKASRWWPPFPGPLILPQNRRFIGIIAS